MSSARIVRVRTRFFAWLAITTVAANAACGSESRTVGVLPGIASNLTEFETRLERLRGQLGAPGMSAAIRHNGHASWQHAFGLADVEAQLPVQATTTFHLASLTKLFGAAVLLRLVDSGLVALDDPVSKYGVSVPSSGTVLVRHLLSMTSSSSPPGERFQYDGDRFALLGQVIQRASGKPFEELAVRWFIAPLNLDQTAPNVDNSAFSASGLDAAIYRSTLAKPYELVDGKPVRSRYSSLFSVAAGMLSTADEVARFAQALDSGTVLSLAMHNLMTTPARNSRGEALPYAFGCFSQMYGGVRVIWAYGLWNAASSLMIHVAERGLTFVVLANADRLSADYALGAGRLLESPLANEFLNAFVLRRTIELP